MSYSPQDKELFSQEEKKLGKQISVCQKVVNTLESEGWKEIIEPTLDRMIMDVVGGKVGDTWISGRLDRAKKDERREFHIGYKQALIDFISRIKFHKIQLPVLEERVKELKREAGRKSRIPMHDTRYSEEWNAADKE